MIACRTVFLSDLHLGTPWCRIDPLLAFLESFRCETLYLVGDVIDGFRLRRRPRWPEAHAEAVRRILRMARHTRVIYVTGNHDAFLDPYAGSRFGNLEIVERAFHFTADGRRLLVCHGDEFDALFASGILYRLGDLAYDLALRSNRLLNVLRSAAGLPYWSLSQFLKGRVKDVLAYVNGFEAAMIREAERSGADGLVCGHIHRAEVRFFGRFFYGNCGDWVESCSALIEHGTGRMELVRVADAPPAAVPYVTPNGEIVYRRSLFRVPDRKEFPQVSRSPIIVPGRGCVQGRNDK
jgi:UDP-2,3-diacylglucosamine pyrophosphatase LpxH